MDKKIRDKIIQLINKTTDQKLLEQVYSILDSHSNFSESRLFDNLTLEQKEQTKSSFEESKHEANLEDHESVMEEIRVRFGWD